MRTFSFPFTSNAECPYKETEKKRQTQRETERKPRRYQDKDWNGTSQGKGHQGLLKLPEGRKRHGTDSLTEPPEGTNPGNTLILNFRTPDL